MRQNHSVSLKKTMTSTMMRSYRSIADGDEEAASLLVHDAPKAAQTRERRLNIPWISNFVFLVVTAVVVLVAACRTTRPLSTAGESRHPEAANLVEFDQNFELWEDWKHSLLSESSVTLPLVEQDHYYRNDRDRRDDDGGAPKQFLHQAWEDLQERAANAKDWLSHKTEDSEDWWSHEEEKANRWWGEESQQVKTFFRERVVPKTEENVNKTEAWVSEEDKKAQKWWKKESKESKQWFTGHASSTEHWVGDEANATKHWVGDEANATKHWVGDEANMTGHWAKDEGHKIRNWWETEDKQTKDFARRHMNETEEWLGEESAKTGKWLGAEEKKAQDWWNRVSTEVRQDFRRKAHATGVWVGKESNVTEEWVGTERDHARQWIGSQDEHAKTWIQKESNSTENWFSDESTATRHWFKRERQAVKEWWATVSDGIHNESHILFHGKAELLYLNSTVADSLISNDLPHDFFALQRGLDAQINQAYCSVATSVAVLNSFRCALELPVDPLYKPYRYATQMNLFNDCTDANVILRNESFDGILSTPGGLSMDQTKAFLQCNLPKGSWSVDSVHMDPSSISLDEMRESLLAALRSADARVVVNFDRSAIGQVGHGHWSPVGSYSRHRDAFLIMDVAKYKYPSVWVPTAWLYRAMATYDSCGAWKYPQAQEVLPRRLLHPTSSDDMASATKKIGCKSAYRGYVVVKKL